MFTKRLFERGRKGGAAARGRFTRLARVIRTRPSALDPLQSADGADRAFEAGWRQGMKRRMLVVLSCVALWVVGIEARLVQLQVFQHDELSAQAARSQQRKVIVEALRGDIVDRHGTVLAYSVEADSIAADPSKVEDPIAAAKSICAALGDCSPRELQDLTARLSAEGQYTVVRQARSVSPKQIERVSALKLTGIVLHPDTRRYYPNSELAAHVLGFVGLENQGQAGVEYAYEKSVLHGEDGLAFVRVDAKRQSLDTRVERQPAPGATLELTIDAAIQHVVERELRAGVEANHARGGAAIVMDPRTGEVLGASSYPTFNPNAVSQSSEDARKNRTIQDVYEPGSTFKIVTASAAVEEGVIKPTDMIDTNPGYITLPGRKPIYDTHRHGVISFEDVIVLSSNVGAIKVGLRTGAERLSLYVHRFGFGQTLSPDLMGESAGIWRPDSLTESGLASVSMGYQVSVTPLQMVTAVSAVANGGLLMEPHLVRAVIRDGRREVVAPKVLRRSIQPETAATVTGMMEGVVERGTATSAKMARYQVAGKTGTAAKLVDGRYSTSDYNASFVGFVPSRRPALAILVVIDTPKAGTYFGGTVSAPIFKRIAEASLQLLGVPPTIDPAPPVLVEATAPAPGRVHVNNVSVSVNRDGLALMPDLRGMSARDAMRAIGRVGLSPRLTGSGFVVTQTPDPGERVDADRWAIVTLQPLDPGASGVPR